MDRMRSPGIDRRRWARLSLIEQLGNVGSEVGRSFAAARSGDRDRRDHAVVRALDLFDATLEGLRGDAAYRAKEVRLARGEFLRVVRAEVLDESEAAALERYFNHFAVAARRDR